MADGDKTGNENGGCRQTCITGPDRRRAFLCGQRSKVGEVSIGGRATTVITHMPRSQRNFIEETVNACPLFCGCRMDSEVEMAVRLQTPNRSP
jgi:hypothetical protein